MGGGDVAVGSGEGVGKFSAMYVWRSHRLLLDCTLSFDRWCRAAASREAGPQYRSTPHWHHLPIVPGSDPTDRDGYHPIQDRSTTPKLLGRIPRGATPNDTLN